MEKVELIICFSDGTWEAGFIVEIPEFIHMMSDVDEIGLWVVENKAVKKLENSEVTYIDVLNWNVD